MSSMFAAGCNVKILGGNFRSVNGTYHEHHHQTVVSNMNSGNVMGNTFSDAHTDNSQTYNTGSQKAERAARRRARARQSEFSQRNITTPNSESLIHGSRHSGSTYPSPSVFPPNGNPLMNPSLPISNSNHFPSLDSQVASSSSNTILGANGMAGPSTGLAMGHNTRQAVYQTRNTFTQQQAIFDSRDVRAMPDRMQPHFDALMAIADEDDEDSDSSDGEDMPRSYSMNAAVRAQSPPTSMLAGLSLHDQSSPAPSSQFHANLHHPTSTALPSSTFSNFGHYPGSTTAFMPQIQDHIERAIAASGQASAPQQAFSAPPMNHPMPTSSQSFPSHNLSSFYTTPSSSSSSGPRFEDLEGEYTEHHSEGVNITNYGFSGIVANNTTSNIQNTVNQVLSTGNEGAIRPARKQGKTKASQRA